MDPKLTTDERKMQEEMLQHEFPFDEKAWASMEALLEREKQKPMAGPPPKLPEALPGPGRKWGLLIALVFSSSLGAASLLWWNSIHATKEGTFTTASKSVSPEPTSSIPLIETKNFESVVQQAAQGNEGSVAAPAPKSNHPVSTYVEQSGKANQSSSSIPTQLVQDQANIAVRPSANPISITTANKPFLDLTNLSISPLSAIIAAKADLNLDSLIRPLKFEPTPHIAHKSGGGVLLGGQLSIVGQQAFQLGSGLVAGCYRYENLNQQLSIQVEFQGKIVSGYKIRTLYEDNVVTPIGLSTSTTKVSLRSLLFFEMPVLLKFRSNPDSRNSFFGGLRPSLNLIGKHESGNVGIMVSNGVFPNDFGSLSLRKAVRRFDLGLTAGWSYAISTRLSLDARYTQGLFDLTADNFFKSSDNTLNSDFQVSLRANF